MKVGMGRRDEGGDGGGMKVGWGGGMKVRVGRRDEGGVGRRYDSGVGRRDKGHEVNEKDGAHRKCTVWKRGEHQDKGRECIVPANSALVPSDT